MTNFLTTFGMKLKVCFVLFELIASNVIQVVSRKTLCDFKGDVLTVSVFKDVSGELCFDS